MPPHRAVQVVFEMSQPVRGLDQRGALARFGPGERDAVLRSRQSDGLLHRETPNARSLSQIGTKLTGRARAASKKRDIRRIPRRRSEPQDACVFTVYQEKTMTTA